MQSSDGLLYLRDVADKSGSILRVSGREEDNQHKNDEQPLFCRQCGAEVTKDSLRISRNEKHQHTFFNPAGIVYEIGCFRDAPGCLVRGTSSDEFSWFAGYNWQLGLCVSCLIHLGWFFSSGDDAFFGLIANRLRQG